jgi:FemAB-related protein (PEP-CTERM system-associated)
VEWSDQEAWDGFVQRASDATVAHLYDWKRVMERAYRHRTFYMTALEGDDLRGVLPLTLVRTRLLGASLVSMPFLDYGGVCADGDQEAETALVEAAKEIAVAQGAVLSLRYLRQPELELPLSQEKVTLFLELGTSEDALWRRLSPERRNRIRKGQKHGLTVSFHAAEGLRDFYAPFATNMRDLGSPVHSRTFFQEILAALAGHSRIILVRYQNQVIGAGLMLLYKGTISIPWLSSVRRFLDKCPYQILYWEAMRFGIGHGCQLLDFGRSSRHSGTFEAKRQWSAEPVQLYWHFYPNDARSKESLSLKRLSWAAAFWKRLPGGVANSVGPWLRRGIPN